jgi:nanoRNase/pAp phosphatase (c-di-AMP/oligoRNAs hydrolase)
VAVLAVERRTATGLEVKLSLRARSDADVCALAHRMHDSGGGPKRAAGVVLAGGLDQVLEPIVLPAIAAALGTGGGCGGSAG